MSGAALGAPAASVTTILPEPLVQQYARSLVGKARASAARTLILRAQPVWDGPSAFTVADQQRSVAVHVRACVSPLAVRDAMRSAGADHLLIITDQSDADLGLGILSRCYDQRVVTPSMWEAVKGSFAAREVDPHLARMPWVAEALVACAPVAGWPVAPTAVLTRDHAMRHLTAELLGLQAADLDPSAFLDWSLASRGSAFVGQSATVREGIAAWVEQSIGPVAELALRCSMQGHSLDAVSIGLAADVLWADEPAAGAWPRPTSEVIAARARLEQWTGVRDLGAGVARAFADAARGAAQRMAARRDPAHALVLQRATALFDSLGYAQGAGASTVLPSGYQARLAALARSIRAYVGEAGDWEALAAVESAFGELLRHDQAGQDRTTGIARMAVRLARWLATPESVAPTSLHATVLRQAREDAFVDWAAADVWVGSTDPEVAEAAGALFAAARARRDAHDRQFATLLADATVRGVLPDALVPVESVIARVLQPIAAGGFRLLLIVVDGMSTAVAAEVADEALLAGWYEAVPDADAQRTATLAALPTLTRYSRTSLLTGRLGIGGQSEEKSGFAALTGGQVFHKADLVGDAGQALPGPVLAALRSDASLVAAVLNTVDDTLAKADPGGTDWTLSGIQHLQPLLEEAARAGRTVVLLSDHGHVVERGGPARLIAGAEARWRDPSTGPLDPAHEVALSGSRVLTEGGSIIAAVDEGVRYGTKQAGYHGGASAAEAVIPIIVLSRTPDDLRTVGWVPATPQAPSWWNDQLARPAVAPGPDTSGRARAPAGSRPPAVPGQGMLDLEVPPAPARATPADPADDLVSALLASPIYQSQKARYGARAMSDEAVRGAITLLVAQGGRAHRDTVAAAAGIPIIRWDGAVSTLRRQLNVEGYPVFSIDVDEVTVVLDIPLLRQQFIEGAGVQAVLDART